VVYVFIGWIMPSYCEKRYAAVYFVVSVWINWCTRLSRVINDLLDRLSESPLRLPSWLHVDASSVNPIVKALDYWASEKSKITSKVTANLTYMDPDEMFRAMAHIPRMNLQGLGDPVPGADDKIHLTAFLARLSFLRRREVSFPHLSYGLATRDIIYS